MNDKDIALLRRIRPAEPPHDPAARSRAWARLHAELDRRPAPRRRVGWRPVAVGAVALGASAAIVATQVDGTTPRNGPLPTVRTLELAAKTVELQPAVARPRTDQWIYTRTMDENALQDGNVTGPDAMLHKVMVEEWWRFDDREMARSVRRGKLYFTGIMRPGQQRPPRPTRPNEGFIGGPGVTNWTPGRLYNYLAGLPTDPDALLARIRRDYNDNGKDVTTFGVIKAIFANDHVISPKMNAALYRALAKIPGVRVVRDATDYAGRHGIGVREASQPGSRSKGRVIVLNPHNYRYMGDDTYAVFDSQVVDRPGQRP